MLRRPEHGSRRWGRRHASVAAIAALLVLGPTWPSDAAQGGGPPTWSTATALHGATTVTTGTPTSGVPDIACWSQGSCVAVGTYADHNQQLRVYVQDETSGVWASASTARGQRVFSSDASVTGVSCGAPGDCVGVGQVSGTAFIEEERSGAWAPMVPVPGLSAPDGSALLAVDCVAAGVCTAVGQYTTSSGLGVPFTVAETLGVWSSDKVMPGTSGIGVSVNGAFFQAIPTAVACASSTSCALGGEIEDPSGNTAGFVDAEVGGAWKSATRVTSIAPSGANGTFAGDVATVSCPAAGACVAGGDEPDATGAEQALLVTQTASGWTASELPGSAALNVSGGIQFANGITLGATVSSLTCAGAGSCTGVGDYGDASGVEQGFIANEVSGSWQDAEPIPGLAALNAGASHFDDGALPSAVRCATGGDCSVVGTYTDASDDVQYFTASESGGVAGSASMLPGSTSLPVQTGTYPPYEPTDLWCGAAGDCVLAGQLPVYGFPAATPAAFVALESAGTWQAATEYSVTPTVSVGTSGSVSYTQCPAAGACVAVGTYVTASGAYATFAASQSHGTWGADTELSGLAALGTYSYVTALSCPGVGDCTIVGDVSTTSGAGDAFSEREVAGTWEAPRLVTGLHVYVPPKGSEASSVGVELSGLSCASDAGCAAVGLYQSTATTTTPFVLDERGATWTTVRTLPGLKALGATSAELSAVTCPSTTSCVATGQYTDQHRREQSLLVDEVHGAWEAARAVPGTVARNVGPPISGGSSVQSVACAAPGSCVLVGSYVDARRDDVPYLANERDGVWGAAVPLPDVTGLRGHQALGNELDLEFVAASCPAPGDCVIVGALPVELIAITKHTQIDDYTAETFVLTESRFELTDARRLTVTPPNKGSVRSFQAGGIGCLSVRQCVVAGDDETIEPVLANGQYQFEELDGVSVSSGTAGAWLPVRPIRGEVRPAYDASIGCAHRTCALGGEESLDGNRVPFVATAT